MAKLEQIKKRRLFSLKYLIETQEMAHCMESLAFTIGQKKAFQKESFFKKSNLAIIGQQFAWST